MLKTLALVLLVANVLLGAALAGLFDRLTAAGGPGAQREPERLQRQVHPERVRILSPQAASAALAEVAASAASGSVAAASAASGPGAAASNATAVACLAAGPFSAVDAATAERTLREAGLAAGSWQAERNDDPGAFLVYMGRYADREALQRKLEQVRRLKVEPADDMADLPELQPGISLGRFADKGAADAALAQLAQRGVRTARVVTLRQAQSQTVLRVPAADAALRARLAGLPMPSGPGFLPCADGTAAAPAPLVAPASATAARPASAARAALQTVKPAASAVRTAASAAGPAAAAQRTAGSAPDADAAASR